MRSECDRTRLIAELASLLRECDVPEEARCAGLTLIGYLARRMPGEGPSTVGVTEVRAQAIRCAVAELAEQLDRQGGTDGAHEPRSGVFGTEGLFASVSVAVQSVRNRR
jgi:hypothetical protein